MWSRGRSLRSSLTCSRSVEVKDPEELLIGASEEVGGVGGEVDALHDVSVREGVQLLPLLGVPYLCEVGEEVVRGCCWYRDTRSTALSSLFGRGLQWR